MVGEALVGGGAFVCGQLMRLVLRVVCEQRVQVNRDCVHEPHERQIHELVQGIERRPIVGLPCRRRFRGREVTGLEETEQREGALQRRRERARPGGVERRAHARSRKAETEPPRARGERGGKCVPCKARAPGLLARELAGQFERERQAPE